MMKTSCCSHEMKTTSDDDPPLSRKKKDDLSNLDDGNERHYLDRIQRWSQKRSSARTRANPDQEFEEDEEEWHLPHPTIADLSFDGGFRIPGTSTPVSSIIKKPASNGYGNSIVKKLVVSLATKWAWAKQSKSSPFSPVYNTVISYSIRRLKRREDRYWSFVQQQS